MTQTLRRAAPSDSGLLFEWVNTPDSLAEKLETRQAISRPDHEAWFANRLGAEACQIHIVEWKGTPIGQVRIELKNEVVEADIYIKPEFRRRGVGLTALNQALACYRRTGEAVEIIARIRTSNRASQKLFRRAGFVATKIAVDHVVLVLPAVGTVVPPKGGET